MGVVQQKPPEKKRSRCCLYGCLSVAGIFALSTLCLITAPFLLQAAGLIGQPADVRYGAAPDVYSSEQIQTTLGEFSIQGAKVYVIPEQGSNSKTAFIILNASDGFNGFADIAPENTQSDVNNRVNEILAVLVDKNRQLDMHISRVAINYRDESGETFMNLTTSMQEVEDYLAGRMTYEEFYGDLGMDFGRVLDQLWEEFNE